jgi:ferric-dicitrate binding protein FerR (iron transport regulator)
MPQPFVMFVPPYSCPGTIDMFFEDRRLALVRGFAVAGVHHDVSSAFAVSSQNVC